VLLPWLNAVSPSRTCHHHCRWETQSRRQTHRWTLIWRHHRLLHPLQRQFDVVHQLRRRRWPLGPSLPVVDSLIAPSTHRADASSSPPTAPMGWPQPPPPTGGPNGPRSGPWRLPPRRPVGRGESDMARERALGPSAAHGSGHDDAETGVPLRGRAAWDPTLHQNHALPTVFNFLHRL
jgi:hypothetical protein